MTRPARSSFTSAPSVLPSGDAATPAAQITVRESSRVPPCTTPRSSTAVTGESVITSTPSRSSCRRALADDSGDIAGSTLGPASIRMMRALPGSIFRKSRSSTRREISASAPAISTPVGPAPIIVKVSQLATSAASTSRSAASYATSTRRRISTASSSVFRPGAGPSHSSCPKYECVEPLHDLAPRVDRRRLAKNYAGIALPPQYPSYRRRNIARSQRGGRHLVEQRLKQVVVAPIDHRQPDGCALERPRRRHPTEAATNDDDVRCR